MSEHDVFYAFGYILAGIFVTGAFSMGLQGVAFGAAYKCASGDATCAWVKEAATRFKLMLQLALGEGDIAKGVRGNFQVVVLIAILLVLLGQWRTEAERKRPAQAPPAGPPCVPCARARGSAAALPHTPHPAAHCTLHNATPPPRAASAARRTRPRAARAAESPGFCGARVLFSFYPSW